MGFTKITVSGKVIKLIQNGFVLEREGGFESEAIYFFDLHYTEQPSIGAEILITIEDTETIHHDTESKFYGIIEEDLPGGFYYRGPGEIPYLKRLISRNAKGAITASKKDLSEYFEHGEKILITIRGAT